MSIPQKHNLLGAAVAAVCLGGLSLGAIAADNWVKEDVGVVLGTVSPSGGTAFAGPAQYASELPNQAMTLAAPGGATGKALNILVSGALSLTPTNAQPFYAKLTLGNGAKFSNTTSGMRMECPSGGPLTNALTGDVMAGGLGSDSITLRLTALGGNISPTVSGCLVSLNPPAGGITAKISVVEASTVNISGNLQFYDGATPTKQELGSVAYISFSQGLYDYYTPNDTRPTVNVLSGSKALVGANRLTAYIGHVRYGGTANTTPLNANGVVVSVKDVSSTNTKFSVTVSGTPVAAATKVLMVTASVAGPWPATCANATRSAAGAQSVTFTGFHGNTISASVGKVGQGICLMFDGNTPVPEGTTYAHISVEQKLSSSNPVFAAGPKPLVKFVKNGSTFHILNIAPSTAKDLSMLRFYNMSSTRSASVRCTAYTQDGVEIPPGSGGSVELLNSADFGPHTVKVLCGSDGAGAGLTTFCTNRGSLQAALGASWTGRAYAVCEVDSTDVQVMALNRDSNTGILTNLSSDVKNQNTNN